MYIVHQSHLSKYSISMDSGFFFFFLLFYSVALFLPIQLIQKFIRLFIVIVFNAIYIVFTDIDFTIRILSKRNKYGICSSFRRFYSCCIFSLDILPTDVVSCKLLWLRYSIFCCYHSPFAGIDWMVCKYMQQYVSIHLSTNFIFPIWKRCIVLVSCFEAWAAIECEQRQQPTD